MIMLTIEKAAKAKGIKTQQELRKAILEKTGENLRAASISDMYQNKNTAINRNHLLLVMRGLETTDFNDVLALDE